MKMVHTHTQAQNVWPRDENVLAIALHTTQFFIILNCRRDFRELSESFVRLTDVVLYFSM